ncbi:MAG: hypothetical protein G01um101456_106 [Parcubacteria group bacterium Gr01-1014_56]|nr:MAG: hypothetical protein G01um101456_106 [Parcubacteria group bacterium Gr01-1014_56]
MKRILAAVVVLAFCMSGLTAQAGDRPREDERLYVSGVFCNKLWQTQADLRQTKKGVPTEVILAALNKEGVECTNASTIEYVFSEVTLLVDTDEELEGKSVYFYEGLQIGIRTSDGKIHLYKGGPAIVYFVRLEPFNSQNVSVQM